MDFYDHMMILSVTILIIERVVEEMQGRGRLDRNNPGVAQGT
jgi:hypothetical protein